MTIKAMRDAINTTYAQHLGKPLADAVPDGVTAQAWHVAIPAASEGLSSAEFTAKYAETVGMGLAAAARALGVRNVSRVTVQDRAAIKVKGQKVTRERKREFIAIAFGW